MTHALREQICQFIALGVTVEAACEQEGIGRATFYDWLRRGRVALSDAENRALSSGAERPSNAAVLKLVAATELPFVALVAAVDQALARAESGFALKIAKAADKDWRAAAWWLERRRPDAYGNRETVNIEHAPAAMTNDELMTELQALGFVSTAALVATTR